jgi:hypothetical protein
MEEQKRRGRERNNKTSLGPPSGFEGWKEKVK